MGAFICRISMWESRLQLINEVTQGWFSVSFTSVPFLAAEQIGFIVPQQNVLDCFCPAVVCCRDEELMKQFTDERDVLESQIEMLQ